MRNRLGGFGLLDLVTMLMVGGVLVAIVVPTLAQSRRLSKRDVCGVNLWSIGISAKIYANDNFEKWMIPAFRRQAIDNGGIDYLAGTGGNGPPTDPGEVGYLREFETTSETALDPDGGSTEVSVTRSFWILVRSGDADAESFICPATRDAAAAEIVPEWYYDFSGYSNISYGYQVPFGPRETRPREGADNDMVFMADKGPYYLSNFEPTFRHGNHLVDFDSPPAHWRRYNSQNHHGAGQNVLFADASVSFERTPAVGIHADNIYTLMVDGWDETGFNRMHGESPHHAAAADFPYPGQDVFGVGANMHSSTDSLIYP